MVNAIETQGQQTGSNVLPFIPMHARGAISVSVTFLLFSCLLLSGCNTLRKATPSSGLAIVFTGVPTATRRDVLGDPSRMSAIKGKVIGARPGQQIVLYAHALDENGQMTWFVQPLAIEPFTRIRADSTWRNSTHPGAEYAALL